MEAECAQALELLFSTDLEKQGQGCDAIARSANEHPDHASRTVVVCLLKQAAPRGGLSARLVALGLCHPCAEVQAKALVATAEVVRRLSDLEAQSLLGIRGLQQLAERTLLSVAHDESTRFLNVLGNTSRALVIAVHVASVQRPSTLPWVYQSAFGTAALEALRMAVCARFGGATTFCSVAAMSYLSCLFCQLALEGQAPEPIM